MKRYIPTLLILFTLIGVLIGVYISRYNRHTIIIPTGVTKVDELMELVHSCYVDSTSMEDIIEETMPKILAELDPHSTYIPAKDLEATNADLKSSFSGIGIRFLIEKDTIHVTDIIRGGPSEQVGLMPGDRIVTINDTLFVGEICKNEEAMKRLKGPKNTNVKIGVKRWGEKDILDFNIIRGEIPMESIDAAYLIDNKWGYIQVTRFAENTFSEFIIALVKFLKSKCQGLIIDVRGNGGGYLGVALQMANEFLSAGDMIVYTEGAHQPRATEYANGRGNFQNIPLVILTDEASASASEILAGTIQDNDRGTVIGRRTFGKGLVQQPFDFKDGSEVRLTIARYYTPSGRCIQKPYSKGDDKEYAMDIVNRYERGEFFSQDSIHQNDSIIYKTRLGRTVYGGGGIMPDIFVSSDTTDITSYFSQAVSNGLIRQYTFQYSDVNRHKLASFTTYESMIEHLKKQNVMNDFVNFAADKGLKARYWQIERSKKRLEQSLYANIIYNMLGMLEHIRYVNTFDTTVLKAVEVLENGKAFPELTKVAE